MTKGHLGFRTCEILSKLAVRFNDFGYRRGCLLVERSPRMLEIGVRSPIIKTGSDKSAAKRLATGVNVTGPHNHYK